MKSKTKEYKPENSTKDFGMTVLSFKQEHTNIHCTIYYKSKMHPKSPNLYHFVSLKDPSRVPNARWLAGLAASGQPPPTHTHSSDRDDLGKLEGRLSCWCRQSEDVRSVEGEHKGAQVAVLLCC